MTLGECRSALLLVSHDFAFLKNTCNVHWHIDGGTDGNGTLTKKCRFKPLRSYFRKSNT